MKPAAPLRLHVLYEHGIDFRPHGSAFLRLLRPLAHPALRDTVVLTSDERYDGQAVDAVIVDRLWRPDVSLPLAENLLQEVRRAGARFIYALDDNLLDLPAERPEWPSPEQVAVVETWLRGADGVLVTSPGLAARLVGANPRVAVLPHALDERLLVQPPRRPVATAFEPGPVVIGYMGTPTHDADLAMVLPALHSVAQRFPDHLLIEMIGVVGREDTRHALAGLPVRFVAPQLPEVEYPLFMIWFTSRVRWDIALSPLRETPFNRCKSDIKFLDYCALGAAGIFSDVPAYTASVRHGETGLLAANTVDAWTEALTRLVEDEELRYRIGDRAARYLFTERTLAQRAADWVAAIGRLI